VLFSGCFIFDYNSNAVVIIKNVGELVLIVQLETAHSTIYPGEQEIYDLTWPGRDDYHINLTHYPSQHPELGVNDHFWIGDGEEKTFEIGYSNDDLPDAR
jgi:hypothetical protein